MLWVLAAAVGVCYGWGMRGCLLGHGKGAMLPGAILGLCVAFMSGSAAMAEGWFFCAALGAAGMYWGGGMTYGQTIGLVVGIPSENYARGSLGLSVKGMLWFGVAATYLGAGISALFAGGRPIWDLAVIAAAPAALYPLGVRLFNRPHDPANGKLPRLYFSKNRPESWGGYLLILLFNLVWAAVRGDGITLLAGGVAAVSGFVGWTVAIFFYYITNRPLKNGKYLLGKAQPGGLIDNWKIMEHTLGFVGGGGSALGFYLAFRLFGDTLTPSVTPPLISSGLLLAAALAWLALAAFAAIFKRHETLTWRGLMAVCAILPFFLTACGSELAARLMSCAALMWVLTEQMCFHSLPERKFPCLPVFTAVCLAVCAGIAVLAFFGILPLWLFFAVGFGCYTVFTLIVDFRPSILARARAEGLAKVCGSHLSVNAFFILSSALFTAMFLLLR